MVPKMPLGKKWLFGLKAVGMVIVVCLLIRHVSYTYQPQRIVAAGYAAKLSGAAAVVTTEQCFRLPGCAINLGRETWPEGNGPDYVGLILFRQTPWDRLLGRPGYRNWESVYIPLRVIRPGEYWVFDDITHYTPREPGKYHYRLQLELRQRISEQRTKEKVHPFGNILDFTVEVKAKPPLKVNEAADALKCFTKDSSVAMTPDEHLCYGEIGESKVWVESRGVRKRYPYHLTIERREKVIDFLSGGGLSSFLLLLQIYRRENGRPGTVPYRIWVMEAKSTGRNSGVVGLYDPGMWSDKRPDRWRRPDVARWSGVSDKEHQRLVAYFNWLMGK